MELKIGIKRGYRFLLWKLIFLWNEKRPCIYLINVMLKLTRMCYLLIHIMHGMIVLSHSFIPMLALKTLLQFGTPELLQSEKMKLRN